MTLPIGGTGPPPIPNGDGRKILEQVEPFRLVSLDAAAFDWLWRFVEFKAVMLQSPAFQGDIHQLQAQVALRAVISFREAAGTLATEDQPVVRKRRLVKNPNPR